MARIVVGIDGSEHSRLALRWAVDEARLRRANVEAVMAWHTPYVGGTWAVSVPVDMAEIEESYRIQLDELVDGVDARGLPAPIEKVLANGSVAHTLLEAAKGADLLVVGSRGHGGFVGLMLGSVSHQVVSHAPCPVVVVPPAAEA